ncbi:MAG: hypothetical protein O2912_01480 [Proteobacteria bacterium]|nr:hypothetical protein [Pseudomonadota bacterium]
METTVGSHIVYDPRGVVEVEAVAISARVKKLSGLRLAVLDNTKWNANKLLRRTMAKLDERFGFQAVNYYRKESFSKYAAEALLGEISVDNDIAITAIAD